MVTAVSGDGGLAIEGARLISARYTLKPLRPPCTVGPMLAAASAASTLPIFASQSSKSFQACPQVEVTYVPVLSPVWIAKVFQVQVSFWLPWNALCFFRAASNCWVIPGFGVWKKMRHTLLAFCALMACVFEPVAGVPVCATHVATKRETTTKVFIGIRIARSWGEILPPVRHSMPAIEHCQKTVAGCWFPVRVKSTDLSPQMNADNADFEELFRPCHCRLQAADWFAASN